MNALLNQKIVVTFDSNLLASSVNSSSFFVKQGDALVAGVVSVSGRVASFKPDAHFAENTVFTATITKDVKDAAGRSLVEAKSWSFTTGSSIDTAAPVVDAVDPGDGAIDVVLNKSLSVTFSEAIDPASFTGSVFTLMNGITPVAGNVTALGSVATFNPSSDLAPGVLYTAKIAAGVKDLAGNALALDKTFEFTTGTVVARGPSPVLLGKAGEFVILSKAGITNVSSSAIVGDIGTSPITGASLVGLDCIQVTGKIWAVDPTGPACSTNDSVYLTAAVSDMEIAYTDAAGRTSPDSTELGAGELGGLTIQPGLHKWGTPVLISSDLKISGGANDVWIFQIAGDLTQANGVQIQLEGGARAENIFWQVAGEVNIGTTAVFKGTLLSQTLVSLKTGAVMVGRALAQTAVTLEANDVRKP